MPISFGNPALLFGALAAALPVIIHFLSRRRVRRMPFSDLRFLDEVQARQARSLGIRRWLLLLLRVLALLILALGVAAPRWGGLAAGGGRAVLFIVDTSASMATQTDAGTRLDEAVAVCGDMIASLPPGAEVQVLTGGVVVAPLFSDWLPAGAGAERALAGVVQDYGVFDLPRVLDAAARQVERAPAVAVELVVVSDLQRTAPGDLAAAASRLVDAGGVRVLVHRVGETAGGGGVQEIRPPARALVAGERITIEATVIPARAGEIFTLDLDGEPVAESAANGEPGLPTRVEFAVTVPRPGLHRGSVRKTADAFPLDDARPFVLAVPSRVEVLIAHGAERPGDAVVGRGGWRVLAAALSPGGDDFFRVRAMTSDRLTTDAVGAAALTVLVDADPLGRQTLAGLRANLESGGALLVCVGDPARADYLTGTLLPLLDQPPLAVFRTADAPGRRGRLGPGAPTLLAGLGDEALTTLEDVVWRRWFQLDAGAAEVVLATAGGTDPLVLTGGLGAGHWGLLGFHLRPEAGDLPGSPMALPLLRRLAAWLARPPELGAAAAVQVGDPLRVRPLAPRREQTFADPATLAVSGPLPGTHRTAVLDWEASRPVLEAGPAPAPGFAVFLAGADTVGLAACGLDPRESVTAGFTPEAWGARLAAAGLTFAGDLTSLGAADLAGAFSGRSLAPWFFLVAGLLLAAELWLGRAAATG